jgi:hypothetical protein
MLKKLSLIALSVTALSNSAVYAASTTANAKQTVTAAIAIVKVSDLEFGSAVQGAVAKTVAAGTVEDAFNASFTVSGEPSTSYTVTLPTTVTMITAGGGTNKNIIVNAFTSYKVGLGNLSAGGTDTLLVGASRAAIGAAQLTGAYTAPFTVDVVY